MTWLISIQIREAEDATEGNELLEQQHFHAGREAKAGKDVPYTGLVEAISMEGYVYIPVPDIMVQLAEEAN